MTLLQFADKFPPHLCRLVARKKRGKRSLTVREIAKISGLTIFTVQRLSRLPTWKGVKVDTMSAFAKACGVEHTNLKPHWRMLRHCKLTHQKRATAPQRRMFMDLYRIEGQRKLNRH